jgi:hypothetical protein
MSQISRKPDNLAILYDDDVLSFFFKNSLVAGVYSIGADPINKHFCSSSGTWTSPWKISEQIGL